jgi:hypothetical protein
MNPLLVITPDDGGYIKNLSTAFVYDMYTRELVLDIPKIEQLINQEDKCIGRLPFRPFGLALKDSTLFIVSNGIVGLFDSTSFEFKGTLDIPLFVNTHQLLVSDNILYTTNTSNDTIGIHDLINKSSKFLSVRDFQLRLNSQAPWSAHSHDLFHVNSLFEYKNRIYFCLHNRGYTPSKFYCFDKQTFEVSFVCEAGFSSHGIVIVDDVLYSLSSATGEVIVYDMTNKILRMIPFVDPNKTFLRGISLFEQKLMIGCSNNHKSSKVLYKNNCFISLMDLSSFTFERYMQLDHLYIITDFILIEG